MFTGLENENRAQEFTLSVKVGRDTRGWDIAEALRELAVRIEDEKPLAGLIGYVNLPDSIKAGTWSSTKGVRD